ncbi:MAG: sigma-54-dependent Fis family transcriptional regulator [Candidatus Omnitrophica bacterium]|nr:sigma-54-dependent Fis family transcriptional regulator [Candidatus Omnitrophota bacterium]MCB9721588.1 sigma-54-dependent Fis family transcriptional regulator [Candidatus Omnitrophota bacterium]
MDKRDNQNYSMLIVDDEPLIRESLFEIFKIEGFRVQMASTAEEALILMEKNPVHIVITDLKLPNMSGLELLQQVKKDYEQAEVIVITGYGSIETAVEAMKIGAFEYITKPINDSEIKLIIANIVQKIRLIEENTALKGLIAKDRRQSFAGMIGSSERMQSVYNIIDSVASTNATILITGESGTGKGMVAKAVHQSDERRRKRPFVEISCGALSETLLESELFGHVKGAFTGAIKDKEGRFEYAKGGTIFLDEIDAFSPSLQVKLLKVLQDGLFERVGENVSRKADARIIVATNQQLTKLVDEGEFREDLYYRINVIAIQMPPLRDRRDDIKPLADHFLEMFSRANNKTVKEMSDEVLALFKSYSWPGNIRELENAIEGAVIMAKGDVIQLSDIPNSTKFEEEDGSKSAEIKSLKQVTEQPERDHIISVLNDCNWNRNKAAAALGVNRTTLYNKMKKYNILDAKK